MNIMGNIITDLDKELKMKNSRIKFLETKLIWLCIFIQYKGL